MKDVSPDFVWNKLDAVICERIIKHEKSPRAIRIFSNEHRALSDYCYWFLLGTLWVNHTDGTDLELWKRLFRSERPKRDTSLMKPSELEAFRALPEILTVYRAHSPTEPGWINYTLLPQTAAEFALRKDSDEIFEYRLRKADAICLFLRREEFEVLSLEPAERVRSIGVMMSPDGHQKAQGIEMFGIAKYL